MESKGKNNISSLVKTFAYIKFFQLLHLNKQLFKQEICKDYLNMQAYFSQVK